jgi:hypothetical protein
LFAFRTGTRIKSSYDDLLLPVLTHGEEAKCRHPNCQWHKISFPLSETADTSCEDVLQLRLLSPK